VAVADDHLHDNGIIEASGERPLDRMRNAGGGRGGRTGSHVGRLTWTVGRTQLVRTGKELDPRPLHIGGMDLVIEGCSEDPLAGPYTLPERLWHNLRRGVTSAQRRSFGLSHAEKAVSSTGWV
jgi:hypothetical protein